MATRIQISPGQATTVVGDTTQFSAQVFDQFGQAMSVSVSWTSSNPTAASVNTGGRVLSLDGGDASVIAAAGSMPDTAAVSVRAARGLPAMGGAIVTVDGLYALGVAGERRIGGPVVTLRDLLGHRTGFPRSPPALSFASEDPVEQRETVMQWVLQEPPVVARGTYSYSNIGFQMAGAMLERAWGTSFQSAAQQHLFDPIGAGNVGFGAQTAPGASNNPVPHDLNGGTWVPCEGCTNPPYTGPSGAMYMALGDWARVIREMLRANSGFSSLVSAPTANAYFTGVVPIDAGSQYGQGWIFTSRPWSDQVAVHSGSNTHNHSIGWVAVDRDFAMVAVTNAADLAGGTTATALNDIIVQLLALVENGG